MAVNFEEKLKQGEDFEVDFAQPFLIETFGDMWVTPCHNYQTRSGLQGGPRMHRANERPVILPDFELVNSENPSDRLLIEAKWKSNPFKLNGASYFSMEGYRCEDYELAAKMKGARLMYLIGCELNRTFYLYEADNYVLHTFNNKYTRNKPVLNRCFMMYQKYEVGKF